MDANEPGNTASEEVIYDIARHSVTGDDLIERARLVLRDGSWFRRLGSGREKRLAHNSAASALRADEKFHEIRLEEDTRITTTPELLDQLPFILTVADAADRSEWMLTVNDQTWAPFTDVNGREVALPNDEHVVRFETTWVSITFCETGSMVSGSDTSSIGLTSPGLIVESTELDPTIDSPDLPVSLTRRGTSLHDDATAIVGWFGANGLIEYLGLPSALTQRLFAEAILNNADGRRTWWGDALSAGWGHPDQVGCTETSAWQITSNISSELANEVIAILAADTPAIQTMVAAARDPESAAGDIGTFSTKAHPNQATASSFTYAIERFAVNGEEEVLVERAELLQTEGGLVARIGSEERILDAGDATAAIKSEPGLSEIRANQITRITASGEALDQLPLILAIPGDPDDFDETLWSETLAEEHTTQSWVVQPGRYRVAFVNNQRWCPFPTPDGPRMLPEAWPTVDLDPMWGHLTFSENGSMVSGVDELFVGLVTKRVAAACYYPDCTVDGSEHEVTLWARGDEAGLDAKMFVEWLLDWISATWFNEQETFAQLFVEAAVNGYDGEPVWGNRLVADFTTLPAIGAYESSEWNLELDLPASVISSALDLVAQRSPRLAEIVNAARNPHSPEGQRRLAAIAEATNDDADSEDQDDDEDDDEDDDDWYDNYWGGVWARAPISRLPKVIEPGEISIRFLWEISEEDPLADFDFIFTWPGGREVQWRFGISPDDSGELDLAARRIAPFHGTASWENGVDVALTYSSPEFTLEGDKLLKAAAPTMMDPQSDERMKRPTLWVDLASRIINFLDGQPGW
jgi:hypothetical protein